LLCKDPSIYKIIRLRKAGDKAKRQRRGLSDKLATRFGLFLNFILFLKDTIPRSCACATPKGALQSKAGRGRASALGRAMV